MPLLEHSWLSWKTKFLVLFSIHTVHLFCAFISHWFSKIKVKRQNKQCHPKTLYSHILIKKESLKGRNWWNKTCIKTDVQVFISLAFLLTILKDQPYADGTISITDLFWTALVKGFFKRVCFFLMLLKLQSKAGKSKPQSCICPLQVCPRSNFKQNEQMPRSPQRKN